MVSAVSLDQMGLEGLVHVWGLPATGKTIFACAVAAAASRRGLVEWYSLDGKRASVRLLQAAVARHGGDPSHVAVSVTSDHGRAVKWVRALPHSLGPDTELVVIDPVTRVLDMARNDPVMWGREMLEETMPLLAAVRLSRGTNIIVISESRLVKESLVDAVHHSVIRRYCDWDVLMRRSSRRGVSDLLLCEDGKPTRTIARLHHTAGSYFEIELMRPHEPFQGV